MESFKFNRDPEDNAEKSLSGQFEPASEPVNPGKRSINDQLFSAVFAGERAGSRVGVREARSPPDVPERSAEADFSGTSSGSRLSGTSLAALAPTG
jgi:hypothetical protein